MDNIPQTIYLKSGPYQDETGDWIDLTDENGDVVDYLIDIKPMTGRNLFYHPSTGNDLIYHHVPKDLKTALQSLIMLNPRADLDAPSAIVSQWLNSLE